MHSKKIGAIGELAVAKHLAIPRMVKEKGVTVIDNSLISK